MPFDEDRVLDTLTLQEKASLTSGADFWHTKPIDRAGVPAIMMTDGPHGVRKQVLEGGAAEVGDSVPATCFPTAVTLASTWDPELMRRVGEALGREAAAQGVAVLLGPGVNIKRTPLCGRNFEYFSEDPHLAGHLAAAYVEGVQSQGVGTSLKHFAVNNQETDRMRVSADVDERTLREIYLPAFEHVVTTAQPWTVMCAYNKVSGVYASEHGWLLSGVLRQEWGFEGLVVSDWGAVHERVASLVAGLDLQMPGIGARPDKAVVGAIVDGRLPEQALDASVRRMLHLVGRSRTEAGEAPDLDAHHELAREAAAAGAVLLKNDPVHGRPLLPLPEDDDVLVVGELARTPRYQGAGSSQVHPTRLDDALTALREVLGRDVPFVQGYSLDANTYLDLRLRTQAVEQARHAGTVVLFLGLLPADESEGYDRERLDLPTNQVRLLTALAEANRRVVVVLANGSVVSLTGWRRSAPAILETWLGGQGGGHAVAELLTGRRSPEGRLTETIPLRLTDTPAYGNFPGEFGHVRYGEGVLVGYRWYDARDVAVAYPFGHGLTYTTFGYDELTATVAGDEVEVSVRVTNTGSVAGAEVVQVYVRDPQASVLRPPRELKAFRKVRLAPGESETVTVTLGARDLSYWHPVLRRWLLEGGAFVVEVGSSSRDIRATATVEVTGESAALPLDAMSTVAEWLAHPVGGPLLRSAMAAAAVPETEDEMLRQIPLQVALSFTGGAVPPDELARLVTAANA
jgi:beta-glucosidase